MGMMDDDHTDAAGWFSFINYFAVWKGSRRKALDAPEKSPAEEAWYHTAGEVWIRFLRRRFLVMRGKEGL